ncbi:MAG: hypothetical protein GIKADHBN_01693 [Phycisphaerales bacterium]|nr:hypothetical protein [Phycisphaerales bacterium]
MRDTFASLVLVCAVAAPAWGQQAEHEPSIQQVVAKPLAPGKVRLLDGPFKAAQDRTAAYLLSLDPDRLLARFRKEAGLAPKAEGYPGWEGETISGHTLGHYLSGCAKMYAATGDARFRDRAAAIVRELAECQAAHGDGYVAAIPGGKRALDEVSRGDIRSKGFDLNGIWVPWYTLHKEMAGLRDCFVLCGDPLALEVMKGLGEYSLKVTDRLDAAQLNTMLRCEHGGMNEVAADLFALTGEDRFLVLARRFNDRQVLEPFAQHRDVLPGLHSNTQIPKFIGAARQAELAPPSGDVPYNLAVAARFFWDTMTRNHTYVTGGNSLNEYLGPPGMLGARLNGNTTETCNTYNMLKLTRTLHSWAPRAAYMDYYERALFNHILASQSPVSAAVCYFVPLRTGSQKQFQSLDSDFTCCVGTGMENHASYGDAIYSQTSDSLMVNLFIASTATSDQTQMQLRQETAFPDDPASELIIESAPDREISLLVRRPSWITGDARIAVNGEAVGAQPEPTGIYTRINRRWKVGDRIRIDLPMPVRVEPTPDDPTTVALLAGPIVLAGVLGDRVPAASDLPYIVTDDPDPSRWIEREPGAQMKFRSRGSVVPHDVPLVPFFRIEKEAYAVYWTHLTRPQWAAHQQRLRALDEQRRALEARTSDFVQPGNMQSERDHGFEGERTNTGEFRGVQWRDAYRGNWFSFRLKLPAQGPATLICTYWGSDTGDREFDILVDGRKLATQVLDNNRPGEFFDQAYDIPAEMTTGKQFVTVRFQAHPQKTAGGVFGVRIVRPESR